MCSFVCRGLSGEMFCGNEHVYSKMLQMKGCVGALSQDLENLRRLCRLFHKALEILRADPSWCVHSEAVIFLLMDTAILFFS